MGVKEEVMGRKVRESEYWKGLQNVRKSNAVPNSDLTPKRPANRKERRAEAKLRRKK